MNNVNGISDATCADKWLTDNSLRISNISEVLVNLVENIVNFVVYMFYFDG